MIIIIFEDCDQPSDDSNISVHWTGNVSWTVHDTPAKTNFDSHFNFIYKACFDRHSNLQSKYRKASFPHEDQLVTSQLANIIQSVIITP